MNKIIMKEVVKVSDIMIRRVITLTPQDTLEAAAQLFDEYNYDGFPVVDTDRKLVGILTAYDMVNQSSMIHLPTLISIIEQIYTDKADRKTLESHFQKLKKIKIQEIMNIDPLVISPDIKIEDLAKEFARHHRVNPIPVINGERKLLGVVSRYDIIRFFDERYFNRVLEDAGHDGILQRLARFDEK